MQVIILCLLLLTGCACRAKVESKPSKEPEWVPALGESVMMKDKFYRNCSGTVVDRTDQFTYTVKLWCGVGEFKLIQARASDIEPDK